MEKKDFKLKVQAFLIVYVYEKEALKIRVIFEISVYDKDGNERIHCEYYTKSKAWKISEVNELTEEIADYLSQSDNYLERIRYNKSTELLGHVLRKYPHNFNQVNEHYLAQLYHYSTERDFNFCV